MKIQHKSFLLLTVLACMAFSSCKKDGVQAAESIEGGWDVVEIVSTYGEFTANGFNPTETIREAGALGTFDFVDETVDYSFTRNDTLFSGSAPWNIVSEKVNQGFIRVPEFTLTIEEHFVFDVTFGDQTKNAERNATEATFRETPTSGFGVAIEMKVEKR